MLSSKFSYRFRNGHHQYRITIEQRNLTIADPVVQAMIPERFIRLDDSYVCPVIGCGADIEGIKISPTLQFLYAPIEKK